MFLRNIDFVFHVKNLKMKKMNVPQEYKNECSSGILIFVFHVRNLKMIILMKGLYSNRFPSSLCMKFHTIF